MVRKCIGCGAILQYDDTKKEGYVEKYYIDDARYCRRCFRVKNYGEYEMIVKNNEEYYQILDTIEQSGDLVLYVMDLFHVDKDILEIRKRLTNPCILVLTKRDILPKKVSDEKLIKYFEPYREYFNNIVVISSYKNYNFDDLYQKIADAKKSKNVFVIGNTNAGKSSLINQILKDYAKKEPTITTSVLPNTTLDVLYIEINERLSLIDTPGLLIEGSMMQKVDANTMKKITPKREIRPITYQIKDNNSFIIPELLRVDTDNTKNSFTFYIANTLKLMRIKSVNPTLKELTRHIIEVKDHEDIVIEGLGFIKIVNPCVVNIYTLEGVDVYTRKNLI